MYVECDGTFISEIDLDRSLFRESVLETIQYAREHPDDTWGSTGINELLTEGDDLLQRVQAEPGLSDSLPIIAQMLSSGQYMGVEFDLPITDRRTGGWNHKWPSSGGQYGNTKALLLRRLAMARLYVIDPHLANVFLERQIIGFHGGGGISLPDILADGLVSHQELHERGVIPFSGEQLNFRGRAKFVSFVEWDQYEIAHNYAYDLGRVTTQTLRDNVRNLPGEYNWTKRKAEDQQRLLAMVESGEVNDWQKQLLINPFSVVWGLSKDILRRRQRLKVDSDVPAEFGFLGWGVPKEVLSIILVPTSVVSMVKEALQCFALDPSMHLVFDEQNMEDALNFRGLGAEWLVRNRMRKDNEQPAATQLTLI